MKAAVVAAVLLATGAVSAQVRLRRPIAAAPSINYGFDNNSGSGCRDYNCGGRCYNGHHGTDFPVGLGTTVVAVADGTVVQTNNGCANYGGLGSTCGGGCGNYVRLQHSDGTRTLICHMLNNSLQVRNGQRVHCGQTLGRSASSGNSSGPHVHLGWQRGGVFRDPFSGRCSMSSSIWSDQNAYGQSPGTQCACVRSAEVCDGRDNDCDGRVDDGLSRSCYTGPSGTSGRGICRAGTQTCAAGRWGACGGQVGPRTETCNRADDDCDGRVDDGVCVMDAGVADAGVRDAGRDVVSEARDVVSEARDVTLDAPRDVTLDAPRDAVDEEIARDVAEEGEADAGEEDVGEDAGEEDAAVEDVVEFEDVKGEDVSDDIAPDDGLAIEGSCGCRAGARSGGVSGLWLVALAAVRRARRRARPSPAGAGG